tara:strand:+ start:8511 stop:9146 length:636 start_codon:yes stop_codon:yes gene_type:complete
MNKTQLANIDIKDLHKADWNYKTDGTEEQIEKLINSIEQDNSVGVLAVRETENGFEVIDGNHRFEAVSRMGWKEVPCENFGSITKATAITIARRRNHKWFDDDILTYAEIFNESVLAEYNIDDLEKFMPDTKEEMENLSKMLDFDWDEFQETELEEEEWKTLSIKLPDSVWQLWNEWKEKAKSITNSDSDVLALEYAIAEAINTKVDVNAS